MPNLAICLEEEVIMRNKLLYKSAAAFLFELVSTTALSIAVILRR
jgi:hypothetical protein